MTYATRRALVRVGGRDLIEDLRIAAHEAAHAVARWFWGRSIYSVTIDPSTAADGRTTNGKVSGDGVETDGDANYFQRCVELVAGSVGELVLLGETAGLRGSDRRKARFNASALADADEAIDHIIAAATAEAEHVLRQNFHCLSVLSEALLKKRTMSGSDVVALLDDEGAKVTRAKNGWEW